MKQHFTFPTDRRAVLALLLWPFLFYWRNTAGQALFFSGDLALFWYPTRAAFAAALRAGSLPLWTPGMFGGFPLFAEMQTGALYPPHLLLYGLLPTEWALNWDILLHLAWMGLGMYLLMRRLGLASASAFFSGLIYGAGGLAAARISHLNVLTTVAWLPWVLYAFEYWVASRGATAFLLLAGALACLVLIGHPQFILLTLLVVFAYLVAHQLGYLPNGARERGSRPWRALDWLIVGGAGLLALALAAVQLLPTLELAQLSTRASSLGSDFASSFSLHPLQLGLLLDPFLLGNPYPRVSVEVTAYIGWMPLLVLAAACFMRRDRVLVYWLAVAAVAVFLALGSYNPVYRLLVSRVLPSFFRAPSRLLYPAYFALALSAGWALEGHLQRLAIQREDTRRGGAGKELAWGRWLSVGMLLLLALVAALVPMLNADLWVGVWHAAAAATVLAALWMMWGARRGRLGPSTALTLVLGATALDLATFSAVYANTYNASQPTSLLREAPRVLAALDATPGETRVYTSRWIAPWEEVMRQSLYPNLALAYGVESAPGYTPLTPAYVQETLAALSPENEYDRPGRTVPADPCTPANRPEVSSAALLDVLGVRYYLVPQVLPATADCEHADLYDPFLPDTSQMIPVPPTLADRVVLESSLAQSASLPDGEPVGELVIRLQSGAIVTRTIEAGRDTAEWAYDRSDVRAQIKHARPPLASTFPARSAIPVEAHAGHTYRAEYALDPGAVVTGVQVRGVGPSILHVASLSLSQAGRETALASLVHAGDHRLVFRSEDVTVFENRDVFPRVSLLHQVRAARDADALARMKQPDWNPAAESWVAEGEPLSIAATGPERADIVAYRATSVTVIAHASAEAYLMFADTWYPGWTARVDGAVQPIARMNVLFRGVRLGPGDHQIEFEYHPRSFEIGAWISGGTLVLSVCILLFEQLRPRKRRRRTS